MSKKPAKQRFEVQENETIDDCLKRMQNEGYMPTRRFEQPVFKEEKKNGKIEPVYLRQKIIFEGKLQ
ncbi:NETI motif-containing protein [Desertibacillus haloalkaliphilus]|uniref:NETI motif-containing protein n=1 Tax=Desertibacillus haloalkaliphilus TaxID=1328930 RepID=UPI001C2531E7|nr:NETI motif-containing protein [Desertibacillus haloalkaliphilus]MBU8906383.1 NETI motif-containing protein [Desertibacillus haloalkaliphilus]